MYRGIISEMVFYDNSPIGIKETGLFTGMPRVLLGIFVDKSRFLGKPYSQKS